MKDKKGNILNVGDYVTDWAGDLSRVVGELPEEETDPEEGPTIKCYPLLNTSKLEPCKETGYWFIPEKFLSVVDEEKALLIMLSGRV